MVQAAHHAVELPQRFFDIEGDGIARQRISRDRKGQAQRIAKRICRSKSQPSVFEGQEFSPLP